MRELVSRIECSNRIRPEQELGLLSTDCLTLTRESRNKTDQGGNKERWEGTSQGYWVRCFIGAKKALIFLLIG